MLAATAAQPFLPRPWRGVAVLAAWLVVPYLALISGGVSPRLMGVRYIDWRRPESDVRAFCWRWRWWRWQA
jgi:hypothetical protein